MYNYNKCLGVPKAFKIHQYHLPLKKSFKFIKSGTRSSAPTPLHNRHLAPNLEHPNCFRFYALETNNPARLHNTAQWVLSDVKKKSPEGLEGATKCMPR